MTLADYLAKNYLNASGGSSEKKSKKRKRKGTSEAASSGLIIADDDDLGWNREDGSAKKANDDSPALVAGRSADLRTTKKSNWKKIGSVAPSHADQITADAILASAEAERNATSLSKEEDPQIEDQEGVLRMESGAKAGLQSADQVDKAMAKKHEQELKELEEMGDVVGKGKETIYRDASGRVVNVAMKRAEARKKAEEEERKKKEAEEAAKGDIHKLQKDEKKRKLEDAKYMTVARYADDEEMNDELKERERGEDPALGFLTKKKSGKSRTGKPLYKGHAAPNRYGIRPGYRWDGVDRGIGFEKEYFAAQNVKEHTKRMEYEWEMDE